MLDAMQGAAIVLTHKARRMAGLSNEDEEARLFRLRNQLLDQLRGMCSSQVWGSVGEYARNKLDAAMVGGEGMMMSAFKDVKGFIEQQQGVEDETQRAERQRLKERYQDKLSLSADAQALLVVGVGGNASAPPAAPAAPAAA